MPPDSPSSRVPSACKLFLCVHLQNLTLLPTTNILGTCQKLAGGGGRVEILNLGSEIR